MQRQLPSPSPCNQAPLAAAARLLAFEKALVRPLLGVLRGKDFSSRQKSAAVRMIRNSSANGLPVLHAWTGLQTHEALKMFDHGVLPHSRHSASRWRL